MTMGTLYGVGVGPGNPQWLTVKGQQILTSVPVVAYPAGGYALHIVADLLDTGRQELLALDFPMTRDAGRLEPAWRQAAAQVLLRMARGQDVAVITEGDPSLYSTFGYLAQKIRERQPFAPVQVVPGISSINGSAAQLGLMLAEKDDTVAVIPASRGSEVVRRALADYDTVILLKVAKVFPDVVSAIEDAGLLAQATLISWVSSEREQIVHDLRDVAEPLPYMTLVVVKKTDRKGKWAGD